MTALLRRAAICAGLAAAGFCVLAQAQSTTVALPERTQLRRALPVAGAPIVQQSPNGLYKLSITDTGIELLGPQGGVRITDAGIEIGNPRTRVTIDASDMSVKGGRVVSIAAGQNIELRGSGTVQIMAGSGASFTGSQVMLGCNYANGKPAARSGDAVNTTGSSAFIGQGSQTVLIC
jgi:uncharacterized Zn-binding protein involved in type VI secretion